MNPLIRREPMWLLKVPRLRLMLISAGLSTAVRQQCRQLGLRRLRQACVPMKALCDPDTPLLLMARKLRIRIVLGACSFVFTSTVG